jgi:hypothetical protein
MACRKSARKPLAEKETLPSPDPTISSHAKEVKNDDD